jgi:DNA-nicking Smr family endonuclease
MSENKVDQHEMWKQGCRAVFAGFIASAHQRGVSNLFYGGNGVAS